MAIDDTIHSNVLPSIWCYCIAEGYSNVHPFVGKTLNRIMKQINVKFNLITQKVHMLRHHQFPT
jgi:hypothetical protein